MLKANNGRKPRNIVIVGVVLSTMAYLSTTQASNSVDSAESQNDLLAQFNMQTDIATKTRLNVKHVPGVVDVMYGAALRKRGYQTVMEALTRLPGFQTLTNSYKTHPNIRGNVSDTFQSDIQILLNGVPQVSGNDLQPFMVLEMPLAAIDRIEVIKGPGSVLYGEYALNGVINIVTVSDAEGGRVHIAGGYFNTHSASASQRLQGDDWHVSMTAMSRRTDGPQHLVDRDILFAQPLARKTPGKADTRNYFDSVVLQAKYKETTIDASYMSTLQGNQFGHYNWLSGSEDYQDELSSEALQLTQGLGDLGGGKLKLFAGVQRHHFDRRIQGVPEGFFHENSPTHNGLSVLAGGIPFPFPQDYFIDLESTVQRGYGRLQWLGDISERQRVLVEASVQHIDVPRTRDTTNFDVVTFDSYSISSPSPNYPFYSQPQSFDKLPENPWSLFGVEKESYSIVLQDEIKVSDRARVTAGVRWDGFEGEDDTYSPRVAIAYELSDSKLMKLQLARAFRPPNLHQDAVSAGTVDYEKMDTLEAQFSHSYTRWALNHVAYVNWVNNKIVPPFAFDGNVLAVRTAFVNSPEQYRYYGLENTLSFQASETLRFASNIAYGRGDGPAAQHSDFLVSPVTVDFNVTWDMTQSVQWFLEHRYWGPRKRRPNIGSPIFDDPRAGLGSQFMTNLSLSISPMSDDRLLVIISSENIFDEEVKAPSGMDFAGVYTFPNDFPQKPRRINAAVEYRW